MGEFEIKRPETEARLVAESIAQQIEGRVSYKRATKMTIASTMRMGAEGIKVMLSGRLNGAEMARSEQYKEGRIPLHTFRADIDYHIAEALTVYGKIGVKVWIMRGEVYGKRDLSMNVATPNAGGERRPGGPGGDRGDRRRPGGGRDRDSRGGAGGDPLQLAAMSGKLLRSRAF